MTMLTDGVKAAGKADHVKLYDIAELLLQRLDPAPSRTDGSASA
jgi:hypothetical protein